jgi:putative effector of murein hydrolase
MKIIDDYIIRGVTLGANSSAMATALLLVSGPRAAAFSSLSMSLFGTVTSIDVSSANCEDCCKFNRTVEAMHLENRTE